MIFIVIIIILLLLLLLLCIFIVTKVWTRLGNVPLDMAYHSLFSHKGNVSVLAITRVPSHIWNRLATQNG